MFVKQELVSKIKDYFDLNMYETKVWLALLSQGIASAGQIADLSGVPRSRTYDVLEGLEKKGFAIVRLGKPVKYLGVKPNMILEKLKKNVANDAQERIIRLSTLKGTQEFTELENLYKRNDIPLKKADLSLALKGKSNITLYLKEILQNTKKEVIICTNAKEFKSKSKLFEKTFEILKNSNIKINLALSGDEDLIKQIQSHFKIKIKKTEINAKFFIIDKKEILFYLSENPMDEDSAIWLNSEFFAQAFSNLFELATKRGLK